MTFRKTNTLSRVHVKLVVRPDMSERRRRADIRSGVFSRRAFSDTVFLIRDAPLRGVI